MDKNLLENLITSKKNIKRKIMEMKRGTNSLNILSKKNKSHISHNYPVDQKNIEVQYASDEDDDNLNSSYNNFFNTRPQLRGYDRSYGMYYDKATDKLKIADFPVTFNHGNLNILDNYYPWTVGLWSLLCEKEPKNTTIADMESYYNILKITKAHLKVDGKPKTSRYFKWVNVVKPLYERMKIEENKLNTEITQIDNAKLKTPLRLNLKPFDNYISSSNAKQKKIHNNSTIRNESFEFSPEPVVPTFKEPPTDELFKFSLSPQIKKGSGLYKDVVPQTQLVYYDDPNELVARLNLLTSAQSAGNTGVNNEIITILEELLRISKYKHIFSKGYTPNWTTEIFTVSKILQTNPITYQLKDESDNIILGGFYEQEIKLTNFPNTFLIERIIKKVKNNMLVKWLGFDSNQNSWISSSDISK
ncbi:hypothetical protein AGLY_014035 [Aphis glycines]|uniref:Chromo domain-containing protein n=1 Tax=Aphis glycines TaxID=307491 RepID=A0A6G0T5D7_APHGL|nr:hypothetical protein AGLY_014035 [Aphis glycines]